jgi:hypothetical protein
MCEVALSNSSVLRQGLSIAWPSIRVSGHQQNNFHIPDPRPNELFSGGDRFTEQVEKDMIQLLLCNERLHE